MTDQPRPWVSISSGEMTAEIDPRGAQLSVLRAGDGGDLLWNGDPSVWAGRAPLLFPIVGVLAGGVYRLGAKTYSLSRHGFARDKIFSLRNSSPSSAAFRLNADASTDAVYPFQFELDVRYELSGAVLSVSTEIRNAGGTDMPASFGYHPGFRWPLPFGQPRSAHYIESETDEPGTVRRIDDAGLLTPARHPTPIVSDRLSIRGKELKRPAKPVGGVVQLGFTSPDLDGASVEIGNEPLSVTRVSSRRHSFQRCSRATARSSFLVRPTVSTPTCCSTRCRRMRTR